MQEDNKSADANSTQMNEQVASSGVAQSSVTQPLIQRGLSKVASNPKQSLAVFIIFVSLFGYIVFHNLYPSDTTEKPIDPALSMPKNVVKPPEGEPIKAVDIPPVPELPKLVAPTSAPPPPPPPSVDLPDQTPAPVAAPLNLPGAGLLDDKAYKREEAKRKSSIVLISGVPPAKTEAEKEMDKNFKFRGDLSNILGQGKIIDAVLETALNTDFGGDAKALVSRDVFAESGKNILIPKGSKIFGKYNTSISGNYGRITVTWSRIDMPSGYSLNLAANSVDGLGRKGVPARVDNKYGERLSNAVLVSAFNIALAGELDKLVPPPPSTNTTTGNIALANSISTTANSIFTNNTTYPDSQSKINAICGQVMQLITDKTSPMYTTVFNSCTQANVPVGGSYDPNLQTLMSTLTGLAASTTQTAATVSTPSQQQLASQTAFKDISTTVKDMIKETGFAPTATVNQGASIRIYVNKDYTFPSDITKKVRVLQ